MASSSFDNGYELSTRLQSGSYGVVYVTKSKTTGEEYAVKVIDRKSFKKPEKDSASVQREVAVMRSLTQCEGVIRLMDFYETPETFHVVLELAKGGDLFDKLSKLTVYTEKEARDVSKQLLETIAYMQERNIVHRDLKPENLLLADSDSITHIKLGDFGFARHCDGDNLRTRCGTPAFVAPEILVGIPYGKAVDLWSVGVVLYMLLGGYPPFQDKHHKELFHKIRCADFVFHDKYWRHVSVEAKKLIDGLLTVNPNFRLDVTMALDSDWLKMKEDDLSSRDLTESAKLLGGLTPSQKLKASVHATRWAISAKFWDRDAVTFSNNINKWDSLFADHSNLIGSGSTTTRGGPVQFKDVYKLDKKIRKGSMATVWECHHLKSNQVYAVKIIKRKDLTPQDDEDVMNEVAVLQSLKHPHIVQLVDFYEEPDYFYMVMEYMEGGDVFDKIVERSHYTEKDARDLMKTLLKTIEFIHSKGVAHRDLKPQNILLKSMEDNADIKLADFGFAKRVHTPECLTSRCGTPTYVAPEILKNVPHGRAVDMWSVGICMYVMLCGYPPFRGDNQVDLFRQVRIGQYDFPPEEWDDISDEAQELVKALLKVDPHERPTAQQALKHAWFHQTDEMLSSTELDFSVRETPQETKKRFRGLAGAMRWLSLNKSAKPIKVEKVSPIADPSDPNLSQKQLV